MGARKTHLQGLGVVETPPSVVQAMLSLLPSLPERRLRVLEPACGEAPFLQEFVRRYGSQHELYGLDIRAEALASVRSILPQAHLIQADYLLWETSEKFDLIIGNPPYGIIGDPSHYAISELIDRKPLYKKQFHTWYGKYNLYGAFIEKSLSLLADKGILLFVVPASWMILEDFHLLRTFLANQAEIHVFYMGKIFPQRNISVVFLLAYKGGKGAFLYDRFSLHLHHPTYQGELLYFHPVPEATGNEEGLRIDELFDIFFAARSPEFRKHPCVSSTPELGYVPVLTGKNLKAGWIDYTTNHSGLWMLHAAVPSLRWFYGVSRLIVAHTKGTRVVAAVEEKGYPWREEFQLVPKTSRLSLHAISNYLNSPPVSARIRFMYRDFVPHLTLPMLSSIRVPKEIVGNLQLTLL